jgi:hypothetical protein
MIDGYTKANPPMQKKLPVEADVLELLIKMGLVNWVQSSCKRLGIWLLYLVITFCASASIQLNVSATA